MKKLSQSSGLGFTLIELLVSVSVFIIIVTIAVGGFVGALRTQRQVAALISANNNVSLAIEQMAREIRTGRNFCDPECPSRGAGFSELKFYNARGEFITYRKSPGGGATIEKDDGSGFKPITGQNALVWTLDFFLSGQDIDDDWPTRVTIAVSVSAKEHGVKEGAIRLQTTVSSRQEDEITP
ncbi:MAG: type II secretion system protein [Patescibacteria group bacterium]